MAISVGSEDLYRDSQSGIKNDAGIGTQPYLIAQFINKTRTAVRGTVLAEKPIGHVDTWSAWTNASNIAVVDATDFLGVDIYPFFESDKDNTLNRAPAIFENLWDRTVNASQGKPVWVTETGWPYSGEDWGEASASANAQAQYWRAVGCGRLFGRVNTWWYTLRDANPESGEKFAVAEDELGTKPRFNLTCPPDSGAPTTVNISSGAGAVGVSWLLMSFVAVGFLLA
ncbi:Glycoside hydrolase subgroup catalytic core [Neofusicoccum parvum]|nr:Glycoside hydrolase subgroup catalytic core [Neofusicoccum parvum]